MIESNKRTTDNRKRTFACIVYPDSAPKNWQEILSASHVQALVSPLHDNDTFENGEKKKNHYHVLVYMPGKVSLDEIQKLFDSFGGVGCEIIKSKSGMTRYLCHLDNPEKAQYAPTDVRAFGGANFLKWAELDNDPLLFIPDIQDFIERHDILSFYELSNYCRKYNKDWFRVISTRCTLYFKEYLKSRAWEGSDREGIKDKIDLWQKREDSYKETGDIYTKEIEEISGYSL